MPRTSGPSKGGSHRTFAGRPSAAGQQAPPHRRPERNSPRCLSDQRKPSRRHSPHAPAGRDSPHSRCARATASPAGPAVRRPRLRLRQVPPSRPSSRHHTQDRPPWGPAWFRPGQDSMGCRADLCLAPPVQTAPHPLRDTRRPPPGATPTRLQHHLLETTQNLILKRSVRRTTPQSTSAGSAVGTSSHGSPAPVSSRVSGSDGIAGRSSGRSPGSSATAASPSGTNEKAATSSPSLASPPP